MQDGDAGLEDLGLNRIWSAHSHAIWKAVNYGNSYAFLGSLLFIFLHKNLPLSHVNSCLLLCNPRVANTCYNMPAPA